MNVYTTDSLTILLTTKSQTDSENLIVSINSLPGIEIKDVSSTTQIDKNYISTKVIVSKSIPIGYLKTGFKIQDKSDKKKNHIKYFKDSLYNSQSEVQYFNSLIHEKYDYKMSVFECALDTEEPLLKRFKGLTRSEELKLTKDYNAYEFGCEYEQNKYVGHREYTRYIQHKNDYKSKKTRKKLSLKIYDKSKEIKETKQQYILNYLENKGLDVDKNINRIELRFNLAEQFISSKQRIYFNRERTDYISKHIYDKHKEHIEEIENRLESEDLVFDSQYLTSKEIIHEFFNSGTKYIEYDIDIRNLFNSEYLKAIFNEFSQKLILNIDELIELEFSNEKIKKQKRLSEKKKKTQKTIDNLDKREGAIYALQQSLDISYSEAEKYYNDIVENKHIDMQKADEGKYVKECESLFDSL